MTSGRRESRRSVFVPTDASTSSPTEGRTEMGKIVISENVTLDGVVQDPTGEDG
jgi:hypothetical protein